MRTKTLFLIGGCSGSFPAPSENRSVFAPDAPWQVKRMPFRRELYGSRTTSFFIRHHDDFFVIDHGLGVEPISEFILDMLRAEQRDSAVIHCLQTHFHEDHLDGLRASSLFFHKGITLRFYSPQLGSIASVGDKCENTEAAALACPPVPTMFHVMQKQFCESYWPVTLAKLDEIGAKREHESFVPGEPVQAGGVTVQTLPLAHPGGCTGFRFELPGVGAVVIATDYEPPAVPDPAVVEFFNDAALLIADMQYRDAEYTGQAAIGGREENRMPRTGWGHGTPERVLPLFLKCPRTPRRVRISHHDPKRPDMDLRMFFEESSDSLSSWNTGGQIDYQFAHEGDIVWL